MKRKGVFCVTTKDGEHIKGTRHYWCDEIEYTEHGVCFVRKRGKELYDNAFVWSEGGKSVEPDVERKHFIPYTNISQVVTFKEENND